MLLLKFVNPESIGDVKITVKPIICIIKGVMNMERIKNIFHRKIIMAAACTWVLLIFCGQVQALESGSYRLLSVSETERLVLVSRIPDQKKLLLDATDVKITINDKPAEFKDLILFTIVQVQMDTKKTKRKNINLDGRVSEIAINDPADNQAEREK